MNNLTEDVVGGVRLKLAILTLGHALGALSIAAVMVMASAIQADFALNQTGFGLLISAYYASQFVLAVPVGWFIDRVGVRMGLTFSHLIASCALFLLSVADGMIQAAAALALLGAAYSLLNPATSKGVFDWVPVGQRGTAMGVKQTGVPLGGLVAAAIAAFALDLDWRVVMRLGAVLVGCGALVAFVLLPASHPAGSSHPRSFLSDARLLLGNKHLHVLGAVNGIYNIGQIGLWSYVTLFLREALHASAPVASLGFGLVQAFSAVGRIGWGRLSDRYLGRRRWPIAVTIGGLAATAFLLLAMPISVGMAIVLVATLGLTIGGYAGLMQAMAVETVEARFAASAIGYNMLLVPAGAMIAPILFGAVVDMTGSFAMGWLLLAVSTAAGGALLLGAKDQPRPCACKKSLS